MQWWQALLLGVVQGVTEFLPVSSSGHLLIVENLLGIQETPLTFDVLLHLGSLVAVIIFFRHRWRKLDTTMLAKLVWATLPIVVVGTFMHGVVTSFRGDLSPLAVTFALTAALLFMADQLMRNETVADWWSRVIAVIHRWVTGEQTPSFLQAFLIGLFQVLAILPGVSRSGSTVSAGILTGLPPTEAFAFAFLMSIPAILGAVAFDLGTVFATTSITTLPWGLFLIGTVVSGVAGFVSLFILRWFMSQRTLWPFALYTALVSILLGLFA